MVFIDNTSPRHDVEGRLMDIHDGNLNQWEVGGRYYWYGIGYGDCNLSRIYMPPQYCQGIYQRFGNGCGFREDHALNVYSSSDLVRWRFEGDALPLATRPRGIYFRPKVIYDARTGEYVLWINYLRQASLTSFPGNTPLQSYMSNISIVVAKSAFPAGPFRVVNPWTRLLVPNVGDFALVTRGAQAFIAYDAWDNGHRVRVERLNDEWTDSARDATDGGTTGELSEADVEAPVLFERAGWYYLLYGSTCCFCAEGGGAVALAAPHPLGPWQRLPAADLNPWNATSNCGRPVPSQNNFVARVATARGTVEYLYMGDLWTTAPDGLKSHDLQYWAPLRFDDDAASPPQIRPFEWTDGFELDVAGAPPGAAAPVVRTGLFRQGSALAKIRENQASCSHSGTFEAWLLSLIVLGVGLLLAACWRCVVCCGRREQATKVY